MAKKRKPKEEPTDSIDTEPLIETGAPTHQTRSSGARAFLCHSSADKTAVRDLYFRLKKDGFSPWLDEEDLIAGQDWEYEIRRAVRRSDVVVVCLSSNSVAKSGFVQKEIRYALDIADEQPEGAIYIIPLRLDPCSVPDGLKKWHWIDYFQDGGYPKLLRAMRASAEKALSATQSSIARRKDSTPEVAEIAEYINNLESLASARTNQFKQAMSELERSYDITVEFMGDALDLKGAETEGHSKRVTAFAIAIAQKMKLPKEEIRIIARGVFLHDIGKMAVPDSILRKPTNLTPEEASIMKGHALDGYRIVKNIPFLSDAAEIVYAHHESYDGSGYPRGLKGDEIPLGARIFSVADTFDALTSDRPYRPRQTFEAARKQIQLWASRQFDPLVVEAFLSMPENIWEALRQDVEERGRFLRG